MRAARVRGTEIEVADVADATGDGVMVHVKATGICGSDLHLLASGGFDGRILGHEIAGVTDDGTPVAVEPVHACGDCEHCDTGDDPRCLQASARLIGIGVDGGLAERVVVPEHLLVPLAPGVPVADACLVEPLAVGVRSVARAGVTAGSRVCVIGGGSIGLAAAAVASAFGASVDIVARHDHQLAAADRLGVGPAADQPYDVVIEAAGSESALADAINRCAPGGTIAVPGTYWEAVRMPPMMLGLKEISIVPSSMYGRTTAEGRDVAVAARVLAERPEIATALISHRFPLDGTPDAFAAASDRAAGAIKVVIEPEM